METLELIDALPIIYTLGVVIAVLSVTISAYMGYKEGARRREISREYDKLAERLEDIVADASEKFNVHREMSEELKNEIARYVEETRKLLADKDDEIARLKSQISRNRGRAKNVK